LDLTSDTDCQNSNLDSGSFFGIQTENQSGTGKEIPDLGEYRQAHKEVFECQAPMLDI